MGGDCLNTGCVPSKALIAGSKCSGAELPGFQVLPAVCRGWMVGPEGVREMVRDGLEMEMPFMR